MYFKVSPKAGRSTNTMAIHVKQQITNLFLDVEESAGAFFKFIARCAVNARFFVLPLIDGGAATAATATAATASTIIFVGSFFLQQIETTQSRQG
jgi:hypothetical protein